MTFKLNDPSAAAAYEARREFFKARARQAMQTEGQSDPDDKIAGQLAGIAVVLDGRNGGSADPVAQMERVLLGELNKIRDDGQRIGRALRELKNALDASSESTKIELVARLEADGVDPDLLCANLGVLQSVAHDLGREPRIGITQGNVTNARTAAIHRAWIVLQPTGASQRACSRIIGQLLDGNGDQSGNIYSVIHEFEQKVDRH